MDVMRCRPRPVHPLSSLREDLSRSAENLPYTAEYSVCVHTSGFGTPSPPGHDTRPRHGAPPEGEGPGSTPATRRLYKVPVEKVGLWDTDSDSSDGSDDELDLAV